MSVKILNAASYVININIKQEQQEISDQELLESSNKILKRNEYVYQELAK